VRPDGGEPYEVFTTFDDITERKEAEQALREDEERWRFVLQASQSGAWDLSLVDHTAFRTLQHDRIFGYDTLLPEWTYEMFLEHVIPEDRVNVDRQFQKAIREGGDWDFECRILRRDGEQRWVWACGQHRRDAQGQVLSMAGMVQDITERKQAEEALLEGEARYRGYVDNAPYGVFVCDEKGRYLEVNQAAAELTGYAREELVQMGIPDVVAPESHEWAREQFARVGGTGVTSGTGVFLRKDGTTFPARLDAGRLTATRYLGFIVDISEQTRAAAELEASAAQARQALTATVAALGATTELRDPYTAGHQRRVAQLAGAIAAGLGWDAARIEMVTTAGLLHDVGKVIVPAEILARPGRLSELEMQIIHGYAAASAELIAGIEFGGPVAAIVNQHHERLDGSGYPQGLTGENILPEARILAVADVVEAMSSHRPYRPALGMEVALAEVREHAGVKFDAEVVTVCTRLFEEQGFQFTP
jgi:PAS domain S-box-containing protein